MNPSFWLVETHLLGSVKAFFKSVLNISVSDTFFLVYWKRSFKRNPSFWLVQTNFLPHGNAVFIYFLDISLNDCFFLV